MYYYGHCHMYVKGVESISECLITFTNEIKGSRSYI